MSATRRRIVALAASAVVGVLVLVGIFVFGVRDLPSYPALADAPDPSITGWVAYGTYGGPENNLCVHVVAAGGGVSRRIVCNTGGPYGWSGDGLLQVYVTPIMGSPFTVRRYDPATGEPRGDGTTTTAPYPTPYGNPRRADGAILAVSPHRVVVGSGSGQVTILEAKDPPDDYAFHTARWSPDGRWVLVLDSEQRLIVASADGTTPGRLLAEGVNSSFDWWQPTG